jgi:hypothetical protein
VEPLVPLLELLPAELPASVTIVLHRRPFYETRSTWFSAGQSPREAQFPVMPSRAIKEDDVDAALMVSELTDALAVLASGGTVETGTPRIVAP